MKASIVHVLLILDGATEETEDVVTFQSFPLQEFMQQFDVDPKSDPHMLDRYAVGPDDVPFVEKYLEGSVTFDFARFGYFIEAARDE